MNAPDPPCSAAGDLVIFGGCHAGRGLHALLACAETIAGFVDAMAATREPATLRRDLASIARAQTDSHLTDLQHP